jgi:hypothetical protein
MLSSPRANPTQDAAIERMERDEGRGRLEVSIAEHCGDRLLEAFERVARAYYATK